MTSVSGFLNKQGFGVWSSEAPREGFRSADVSQEVADESKICPLTRGYEGSAKVASYTVLYVDGHTSATSRHRHWYFTANP